jgi:hypothetical protein
MYTDWGWVGGAWVEVGGWGAREREREMCRLARSGPLKRITHVWWRWGLRLGGYTWAS